MKTIIHKIVKKEGKDSLVARTLLRYKNSKQFHYLFDLNEG